MIKTIIFTTDFSALSMQAFKYTIALAKRTNAKIIVCYALEVPSTIYSLAISVGKYTDELKGNALARLTSFVGGEDLEGVEVETRLCSGLPEQVLNDLAAELEADLVVMARHSRSTLERFFMGSTTEKILHETRFPILVVPHDGPRTVRWKPVLCAVDFSETSKQALHFSIRLVKEYGAELSAVHVVEFGASIERIATEKLRAQLDTLVEKAKQELDKVVHTHAAPAGTTTVVAEGKPAPIIVEQAGILGADLVIVGERGHSLLERMAIGSTTSAILRSASVPVLVVPAGCAV